ncbi:MAG: hypothetical protein FWG87_02975 [Defluviitaleaceae bacterium]|nr:hypothetical protein [Defluviitaleaceae bacterium]
MTFIKRTLICMATIPLLILTPTQAHATPPTLDSPSAILIEQTTGRILYSRNERDRRFPASMTALLTALVAYENLDFNEEITIGTEIRNMPAGFATNVHSEGETLTVRMLLHSFLIRSTNEAGRVLALNTVRKATPAASYAEAERLFSDMLNEKAAALGARGTQFNNPFGQHFENHFTTALDIAIITRAFMEIPELADIVAKPLFEEGGYSWASTNQMLPDAPHGHPYIIGAKAGFTTPAGHVFAGVAYNDELGMQLVSVVMGGTDIARWQDTRRLIDYGFTNFRFREIAQENTPFTSVTIENPRLGDEKTLEILFGESYSALLTLEEYNTLTHNVTFDTLLYVETEEAESVLRAPLGAGARVGTVAFLSGDTVIHEMPLLAAREVIARNFDSDMDYYLSAFFGSIFTLRALPYWFGLIGTIVGIMGIIMAINANRRAARGMGYTKPRGGKYKRY